MHTRTHSPLLGVQWGRPGRKKRYEAVGGVGGGLRVSGGGGGGGMRLGGGEGLGMGGGLLRGGGSGGGEPLGGGRCGLHVAPTGVRPTHFESRKLWRIAGSRQVLSDDAENR